MLASIFIIGVSLVLFLYWFRYTCVLILNMKSGKSYAAQVATANQLSFIETRSRLSDGSESEPLDRLHGMLDRDYAVVTYLLRHASHHHAGGASFEQILLRIDYRLMSIWYAVVRSFSESQARQALLEMTSIVNYLANTMGERVAITPRS